MPQTGSIAVRRAGRRGREGDGRRRGVGMPGVSVRPAAAVAHRLPVPGQVLARIGLELRLAPVAAEPVGLPRRAPSTACRRSGRRSCRRPGRSRRRGRPGGWTVPAGAGRRGSGRSDRRGSWRRGLLSHRRRRSAPADLTAARARPPHAAGGAAARALAPPPRLWQPPRFIHSRQGGQRHACPLDSPGFRRRRARSRTRRTRGRRPWRRGLRPRHGRVREQLLVRRAAPPRARGRAAPLVRLRGRAAPASRTSPRQDPACGMAYWGVATT